MSFLNERQKQILQVMGVQVWQERGRAESQNAVESGVSSSAQAAVDGSYEEYVQSISTAAAAGVQTQDTRARPAVETPGESTSPVTDKAPDVSQYDWSKLKSAVTECRACELAQSRTQTVFGTGNQDADWLFIGEAPGAEEDRRGEPFVGRAGQLLDAMFKAILLDRQNVFIANVLKCRPPGNRDPKSEEALLCSGYLNRQIALIKPKVIVAVGRIAAQQLLQTTDSLVRLRGKVHYYGASKTPMIVTYHPAYLLRSPAQKRKAWEDLLLGQRVLSEKA